MSPSRKPRAKPYPRDRHTVRPYRIWNAKARKPLPHRYFAYPWTAIDGCWKDVQWAKVGQGLEVYVATTQRHIATMMRKRGGEFYRWVHPDFNTKHQPKKAPKLRLVKGGK